MQIDKQQIISLLLNHGQQNQADAAGAQLPDQVDTEQHADILAKLGINLPELLGGAGGLGGIAGKLGL